MYLYRKKQQRQQWQQLQITILIKNFFICFRILFVATIERS